MPQITRTKLGAANFGPWENIVRVLILVWFMLYTLNAIPDIHPLVGRIAAKVNYWISYFFMFEYILRVLRQTAEGLYFQRHGYSGFYCLRAVPGHVFRDGLADSLFPADCPHIGYFQVGPV